MKTDLENSWGNPTEPWNGPDVVRAERNRQFGFDPDYILATANQTDEEIALFCKQELERYFQTSGLTVMVPGSETEFSNPLKWWAVKKTSFPTVWLLAKYYLGIPATSANSERCFSYAGDLLDTTRTRMSAGLAEDTFFVNRNFGLLPHTPSKQKKAPATQNKETVE